MNMKRMSFWFYVLVAAQVLFLLGETTLNETRLRAGTRVILKVVPVDPRSLFMGNYLELAFDISTPPHRRTYPRMRPGDTAYVLLNTRGPVASVRSVLQTYPRSVPEGCLVLRGVARRGWNGPVLSYGIERYYIPEARQREAAALLFPLSPRGKRPPPQVTAEVVVGRDGQGMLKHVLVDGKPLPY